MKTENELIEDFWISQGGKPHWKPDLSFYESSWDMLMPVVEKIESIYKQGKLFQCPQYQRIRGVKITDVTITELHALIVDFIKWYNSQNF